MTSPPHRKWMARIESGTLTKGQIHSWAYTVAPLARDLTPARSTNLHPAEAIALTDLLAAHPVRLTPDHEAAGLAWLRKYGADRLGWDELPVLLSGSMAPDETNALDGFRRFTFDGEVLIATYPPPYAHRVSNAQPVWTIHFRDGSTAKYHAAPWQAETYGRTDTPPPSYRWTDETSPA